jgi:hypothetical protein
MRLVAQLQNIRNDIATSSLSKLLLREQDKSKGKIVATLRIDIIELQLTKARLHALRNLTLLVGKGHLNHHEKKSRSIAGILIGFQTHPGHPLSIAACAKVQVRVLKRAIPPSSLNDESQPSFDFLPLDFFFH